jgi:Zn-dependent peptidase ImmA (M78 family)/DNA-binding XRE family transcriptional regulator
MMKTEQVQIQVDGNRIRLARESRKMTQSELAEALSVSPALISRWELQLSDPGPELLSICKILKYAPKYFVPEKIFAPSILSHNYRKTSAMSIKDKKAVEAVAYIRVDQISRIIEKWATFDWGIPSYDPDQTSPEEIATNLRIEWGLNRGPIPDLTRLIESKGVFIFLEEFADSELDGITVKKSGIPPVIFLNSDRPGERIRFTLAHELGHLVMHSIPRHLMEEEAHSFAAAFLMPKHDIADDLRSANLFSLSNLKAYWKVSLQALIYRAQKLESISLSQSRRLFMEINKNGWKRNEPIPINPEIPGMSKYLIDHIMKSTKFSLDEIAETIGADSCEFKQTFCRYSPKFGLIRGEVRNR